MNNIKSLAIASDGTMKRIAITYDVIDDETGKITKANVKVNRVVTDATALAHISGLEDYAMSIIEANQ